MDNARATITLTRDADASTFMYLSAYHWLEQLLEDAKHPLAPDELKADAATVRKWLGATTDDDITYKGHDKERLEAAVEWHEKFATGFQQNLREGIAPSPHLAREFHQFKAWVTPIYDTIEEPVEPISEDIRGVFDRMLAIEPRRTVYTAERGHQPSPSDIYPDSSGTRRNRLPKREIEILLRE